MLVCWLVRAVTKQNDLNSFQIIFCSSPSVPGNRELSQGSYLRLLFGKVSLNLNLVIVPVSLTKYIISVHSYFTY